LSKPTFRAEDFFVDLLGVFFAAGLVVVFFVTFLAAGLVVFLGVPFPAVFVAIFFWAPFAAGFRLALTTVVLVAFFLPVLFLAGTFFTAALGAAFFVVVALGFRAILFFAVAPVLFLAGLVLFLTGVLFLEVAVLPAFALFDFDTVELRPLEVFFAPVLAPVRVFPTEVPLRADFRAELFPGVVLPETLFLRAADAVVLPEVFFAELPPLVFLPAEVLFLGIAVLLLIQIHSISVFLFMW
jgi:hypothetical protein